MFTVKQDDGAYYIEHISDHNSKQHRFHFLSAMLPDGTAAHMSSIFNTHSMLAFHVTKQQDDAIVNILRKLKVDHPSSYIFEEQLKKTHLVELVHLITKIQIASSQSSV